MICFYLFLNDAPAGGGYLYRLIMYGGFLTWMVTEFALLSKLFSIYLHILKGSDTNKHSYPDRTRVISYTYTQECTSNQQHVHDGFACQKGTSI